MTRPDDLPQLWCRFCKELTRQLVDELNSHARVCSTCWRRQKDGVIIEIEADTKPKRASTTPPPMPTQPHWPAHEDYALRIELHDLMRRIAVLEQKVTAHDSAVLALRHSERIG